MVKNLKVALLHLDLGIGGAEQLVVTLARLLHCKETEENPTDLRKRNNLYDITLFTTHHEVSHCFEETKPDGILGKRIVVIGDWLPRKVFGRFTALCAIIRMCYLAVVFILFYSADLVILDGVSAPIPLLNLFSIKVLFYCHFPDLLLCTNRSSVSKKFYRCILDKLESWSTGQATKILVNSEFTAEVFKETFPAIARKEMPTVLYPVIKISRPEHVFSQPLRYAPYCKGYDRVFVSLNRYERKKKVEVAVDAMRIVSQRVGADRDEGKRASRRDRSDRSDRSDKHRRILLVVAGGYDLAVQENVQYLEELMHRCSQLGLRYNYLRRGDGGEGGESGDSGDGNSSGDREAEERDVDVDVVFRTSITSDERTALFLISRALLYTPDREHFGIVPIEAMGVGLPVIAVSSGGPKESVHHNESGFLCEQTPEAFAGYMYHLLDDEGKNGLRPYSHLSAGGKARVQEKFSEEAMGRQLFETVDGLCS